MKPYGCNNSERKESYPVHERQYANDGNAYGFKITTIEDKLSRDCKYDHRATDYQCSGCRK